eukprot:IDg14521t1
MIEHLKGWDASLIKNSRRSRTQIVMMIGQHLCACTAYEYWKSQVLRAIAAQVSVLLRIISRVES